MEFLKKQAGTIGGRLISGTTAVTGSWYRIVMNTDTVFDELKVGTTDVVTARGLSTKTIKAGMELYAGEGDDLRFTEVKLTSGDVMVY